MRCQRNIHIYIVLELIILLFSTTYVYAETIVINVGGSAGTLRFDPQNVTANQGDVIQWRFLGGNHNVVQGQGLAACDLSQEPNAFRSVTNPPSRKFEYTIKDEVATLYYFCAFASHCQNGMWGAIYVGGTEAIPITAMVPKPTSSPHTVTFKELSPKNNAMIIIITCIFGVLSIVSGFFIYMRFIKRNNNFNSFKEYQEITKI